MTRLTHDLEDIKICHFDEFYHYFSNSEFHIICISKTWLRPGITDDMVRLPGYTLYRCDKGSRIGRVGFYLLDCLHASVMGSSSCSLTAKLEFIMSEILIDNSAKLLLVVVYKPPNSGYLNEFFQLFLKLQVSYRHSVILGDFNADMNLITFDSQ